MHKTTGTGSVNFEIISKIDNVQRIAQGTGVDKRHQLNRKYGRARWRKLKGIAIVEYDNGEVWLAEVHWFEGHGIGRVDEKVKRKIRRYE